MIFETSRERKNSELSRYSCTFVLLSVKSNKPASKMSIERIGLLDEVTAVERELLFTSHDELPHYESVHGTIKVVLDANRRKLLAIQAA